MDSASKRRPGLQHSTDLPQGLRAHVPVCERTATNSGVITACCNLERPFQVRLDKGLINPLLLGHLQHLGRKIEPITYLESKLCQILRNQSRPTPDIQNEG